MLGWIGKIFFVLILIHFEISTWLGGINFEFQIRGAPADSIRMCRSGGRFPWLSNMLLWGTVGCTRRESHGDWPRTMDNSSVIVFWITYLWFHHLGTQYRDSLWASHVMTFHFLSFSSTLRFLAIQDQPLLHTTAYTTLIYHRPEHAV